MKAEGYSHENTAKQEHVNEICRSAAEGAFLQHPAVSVSAQVKDMNSGDPRHSCTPHTQDPRYAK